MENVKQATSLWKIKTLSETIYKTIFFYTFNKHSVRVNEISEAGSLKKSIKMKSQGMVGNCFWQLFDIAWLIFLVRQINSFAVVDLHSHKI